MPYNISTPLNTQQIQVAQTQGIQIASSASRAIYGNQFVFFAAFDGTNNTRDNPRYSDDPLSTGVGQMESQVTAAGESNRNVASKYYPGPGTPGTQIASSALPQNHMIATAEKAYKDFAVAAEIWLNGGTGRSPADITTAITAITGFSRGAPTGVIFAQLLSERGLTAADGTVLIPKGQVTNAFDRFDSRLPRSGCKCRRGQLMKRRLWGTTKIVANYQANTGAIVSFYSQTASAPAGKPERLAL